MAFDSAHGVTVLFGGYGNSDLLGDTWEWDGEAWLLRSNEGPSPRTGHAMAYDSARHVCVLFGGSDVDGASGETWEWDGTAWTLRTAEGPSPRDNHAMAYDAARAVTVLFGPTDTWEWNGDNWALQASDGPPVRWHHAMAYDASREVVVLFGGVHGGPGFYGDTWEWDGQSWSFRDDEGPDPRAHHAMAFDIARTATVLFGGQNYFVGTYSDTWAWDGIRWTRRLVDLPPARDEHAMAYDSLRAVTVMFGGSPHSDTWKYPAEDSDCNTDGVGDACEVNAGTAADCNTNIVPDECEDCDTNGAADACDIASASATDCNFNGLPDTCDLASGASDDCNTNGASDDCEPDCNTNGINDVCDLTQGSAIDCNTNAVPDGCEDCNTNGLADACDLAAGTGDCNTNGRLDPCDVVGIEHLPDEPQMPIPEHEWTPTPPIEFLGAGIAADVNVCVNIRHTSDADLIVLLSHDAETVQLFSHVGSYGENFTGTCLDDEAQLEISSGLAPFTGTFRPQGALADFDGQPAAGSWSLSISDSYTGDTGTLLDWALALTMSISDDCNTSGIPDECEPGALPDCNTNGQFDQCEGAPDCNTNAVPDNCDSTFGTALDCNTDLVPDECDLGDCGPGPAVQPDWDNGTPDGVNGAVNQVGGGWPTETIDDLDCGPAIGLTHVTFDDVEDTTYVWNGRVRVRIYEPDSTGLPMEEAAGEQWIPAEGGAVWRVQKGELWGRPHWQYSIECTVPIHSPGVNWLGVVPASDDSTGQAYWLTSAVPSNYGASYIYMSTWIYTGWHAVSDVFGEDYDFAFNLAFGCRDCNANSVPDVCDIADGVLNDINTNTIADECEFDCDHNGVFDYLESEGADCNTNGRLDVCDVASSTGSPDCDCNDVPDECQADCDTNGVADACELDCNDNGVSDACDAMFGTSVDCDSNLVPDECEVVAVPCHYEAEVFCDATIIAPALIGFTVDEPDQDSACTGGTQHRFFAGRTIDGSAKVARVTENCTIGFLGPWLKRPRSVFVDVHGDWPGPCGEPNNIIVGGRTYAGSDVLTLLDHETGSICDQLTFDDAFGIIGQMAIDSTGRLYIGSVENACLYRMIDGWITPFYCPGTLSPRAVALDADENVYVTCAVDGVLRIVAPDGTPLDEAFATGLEGAISQAFAPPGIFHGNLFVACGDRVMEVDLSSGASTVFIASVESYGIAFDPDGCMYVSAPSGNQTLKVGRGLPGDMTGDGVVDAQDLPGFVAALLQAPDAPRPILTADMDEDGCATGEDIALFLAALIDG